MPAINKYCLYDESHNPFERLEELIENYGLSRLMDETRTDERLSGESALAYYKALKNEMES